MTLTDKSIVPVVMGHGADVAHNADDVCNNPLPDNHDLASVLGCILVFSLQVESAEHWVE